MGGGGLVKGVCVCVCVCEEIKNLTSVTWPKKARDINWAEGIQKDLDALPFRVTAIMTIEGMGGGTRVERVEELEGVQWLRV